MNHNTLRKYLGKKVQHKSGYTMFVIGDGGNFVTKEFFIYLSEVGFPEFPLNLGEFQISASHKVEFDKFLSEWSLVEE